MTMTEPFGVYVHWPFCLAKCPYCDFNSHVRHGGIDQGDFVTAYLSELNHFASLAPGRIVSSIFFGGGTPSLMAPETVGTILDRIAELWTVAPDAEITLEGNPTSVEAGRFAGYRAAGVNRVSLGVQSLDDASLKALGRKHTSEEALAALDIRRFAPDALAGDAHGAKAHAVDGHVTEPERTGGGGGERRGSGHELIVFDINRHAGLEPYIRPSDAALVTTLAAGGARLYRRTLITNLSA